MKHKRRESRETAFSLVFEWGFKEEESLSEIIQHAALGRSIEVDPFAMELASRTINNSIQLDEMIKQYSKKWKINRIPRVTLAVLRMSFCELALFENIPVGATINEAVELVKKFATEEDAAYVNGLLGQFERDRTGVSPPSEEGPEEVTGEQSVEEKTEDQIEKDAVKEIIEHQSIQAAEHKDVEISITEKETGE